MIKTKHNFTHAYGLKCTVFFFYQPRRQDKVLILYLSANHRYTFCIISTFLQYIYYIQMHANELISYEEVATWSFAHLKQVFFVPKPNQISLGLITDWDNHEYFWVRDLKKLDEVSFPVFLLHLISFFYRKKVICFLSFFIVPCTVATRHYW